MLRAFFLSLFLISFLKLSAQEDLLARNYMQQGAYEKAAILYEGLVEKTPGNTNLVTSLVEAYQQLEQYDKAQEVLLKTLALSKSLAFLKVNLGRILVIVSKMGHFYRE